MKLIIQIPCLNEAGTIAETIADLPKEIDGVDEIEYLVIDDGSTDKTVDIVRDLGVHHVLSLGTNRGLATAFTRGKEYALANGADILVNTDGDNQYCGHDIPKLVKPIIDGSADLVVGNRPIVDHPEFGFAKKMLQVIGSAVLRFISKTSVRDAPSGFRAFSKETCQRLHVYSRFSYCMETLIQAGNSGLKVKSVDIRVNGKTRESRLFKSIPQYIYKTGSTMISMFVLYRPGRFFFVLGFIFFALSFALGIRYLYFSFTTLDGVGSSKTPSLTLLAISSGASFLLWTVGIIGELMKAQRKLSEEILFTMRKNGK
jgi:glycosyltransferase involved in cell wall biosynthesis